MNTNNDHSAKRANKDLTPQERKAKRELKRQLKVQQKRARLETRLRHAMSRNDSRVEAETRQALQAFNEKERTEATSEEIKPHEETPERAFVKQIYSELQRKQQTEACCETKQAQTDQAVALLRNMTKGTQQKHMFEDANTLWGYTRQKFFERAMLVCESFLKLRPTRDEVLEETDELRRLVWDRFRSVRRICSIGCGPGPDAVGAVAFLKAAIGKTSPTLDRALLLDWAMEDWKLILGPLCDIMVPKYVQTVETSTCDISKSLSDTEDNRKAKELILHSESLSDVDLFLVSYLLTEVRGQWYTFMEELIQVSKPNTQFYFADPTPWQLHLLRERFGGQLSFIWLDSSMDHPELQPLDKRLGPAVLLGYKHDNIK